MAGFRDAMTVLVCAAGVAGLLPGTGSANGFRLPTALGASDSCRALEVEFEIGSVAPSGDLERGSFMLRADGAWRAEYQSPVHQITISTAGLAVFLYPEDRRAVRLWTKFLEAPAWMTFAAQALYSAKDLAAEGFQLAGFEARGDTTVTSWRWPRANPSDVGGVLQTFHRKGLIVRLDLLRSGALVRQVLIEQSEIFRNIRVPALLRLREWQDGSLVDKTVRLAVYRTRSDLGLSFEQKIPASYRIDERRW